ncbi:MAG: hypothetical protein ONB37_13835, partial [candidate division KSB1 bacterium]|nr:hypothetical protein [candidate division KSB1 bacterium]
MLSMRNYFRFALRALILQLVLIPLPINCIIAQANFFPLGLWNYDICGPEHTVDQPNEMLRIDGLHGNYFTSMSLRAQPGMIDTCNRRNGTIVTTLTTLSHDDTTGGYYYPVRDYNPYDYNSMLSRYISDNQVANIQMALIDRFINRVYNRYQTNHAGIGAIQVAHQGYMDQQDHFAFIRHAGRRIQQLFGDDVQSTVVHNIFQWDGGTTLQNFFSYMGDSLDVYQHEQYPLRMFNQTTPPYTPAPYMGNDFQQKIDTLVMSYQQTWEALKNSGNNHTKLEIIFQTFECYNATYHVYWRRPTQAEIWLQAFLALSRNAKGVHSYVYRSYHWGGATYETGLIDSLTRNPNQPTYSYVADLYTHLDSLGPRLLPLTVLDAFTWTDTAHSYITDIIDDVYDGGHGTIEISLMDHPSNNYDYFLLVNRRCSSDNNGTPAPPQTITVRTNKSGQYQIRDLYSGELFVTSNGYFRNITIGPGRGRLFELRPMFAANETWDTDTVNVSSSITVPSGKTLTIAPNSTVKFYTGQYLLVQGKLVANGTASQHIKFTAAAANPTRGS